MARVVPAHQGFQISKLASSGAQDRLEPNFQSIAAERFCEVPLYVAPHFEVFAQVVIENIVPVAPFGFCTVERSVCLNQHLVDIPLV